MAKFNYNSYLNTVDDFDDDFNSSYMSNHNRVRNGRGEKKVKKMRA